MMLNLSKEKLVEMYRLMVKIRLFEEKVFELYAQNLVPGTIHLYTGQEAVAVGVCSALRKDDYITSTHRGHGHCIAKGADVKRVMAEILGKKTGYCKGKGGSMHIADFSIGMLGATAVVGA
ncbi:MAG: thiamine pyrophosphate-dependent enzyme, partial [Candidatus Bathyarchaeia archaeon]